jgi:hypothetical protein
MLELCRTGTLPASKKEYEKQDTGSTAISKFVQVSDGRSLEVAYEIQKWLGQPLSKLFAMNRATKRFALYTGVVTGVFINEDGYLCYGVRFLQNWKVPKSYIIVASRQELDSGTEDADAEGGSVVNDFVEYGGKLEGTWTFKTHVLNRYSVVGYRVARVFSDPVFYAKVRHIFTEVAPRPCRPR